MNDTPVFQAENHNLLAANTLVNYTDVAGHGDATGGWLLQLNASAASVAYSGLNLQPNSTEEFTVEAWVWVDQGGNPGDYNDVVTLDTEVGADIINL